MHIDSEKEKAREHWLNKAVYEIDTMIFNSALGTLETKFQCTWGRIKSGKQCESVDPRDYPELSISDFFPITIAVSWELKDPKEILLALAYEMCRVFGDAKRGKSFHKNLEKWYFDEPYGEPHATFILDEKLDKVYESMKRIYGDWPGISLTIPKKERKPYESNIYTYICPECGVEIKCDKRKIKQSGTFTCICGAKMALATPEPDVTVEQPQEQGSPIVAEILGQPVKSFKSTSIKSKRLSLRVSKQDMQDFPYSSLKINKFYEDLYNPTIAIKSKFKKRDVDIGP